MRTCQCMKVRVVDSSSILSYLLKALEGLNVLKHIKPGHENSLGGVRLAAKVPYDIIDEV